MQRKTAKSGLLFLRRGAYPAIRKGQDVNAVGEHSAIRKAVLSCGLPEDAVVSSARVTINGKTSVTVEGHRGVAELSSGRIRLDTDSGALKVEGERLELRTLSSQLALITGEPVCSVAYL